jgi:hypothetical protein
MPAVTPDNVLDRRLEQSRARYEQTVSRAVDWLHKRIIAKFKSPEEPIKVSGFVHSSPSMTRQVQQEIVARLRAEGWLIEYPTWRHPLRVMNGTILIRAIS